MFYHNITHDDLKNGDGLRVVLWVAGCEHHCPNCQNEQTWDYHSGIPFDLKAMNEIIEELSKEYISGITFSGGDPLAPHNREIIMSLIVWIRFTFPNKTIWVYTGYKYEQLLSDNKYAIMFILRYIDVLIDGKYLNNLRNTNLKWRGSSNQRVIDVQKSLEKGEVVLWCD